MISARVTGWTDASNADVFQDEHGYEWVAAYDAIDGTIAVERKDGHQAGIFRWDPGADSGTIALSKDGDTYGVNCTDEFVARDGEWVENDDEERDEVADIMETMGGDDDYPDERWRKQC